MKISFAKESLGTFILLLLVLRFLQPIHLGNAALDTLINQLFVVVVDANLPVLHLLDLKVCIPPSALFLGNKRYAEVGLFFTLSAQEIGPRGVIAEGEVAGFPTHVAHVELDLGQLGRYFLQRLP